MLRDVTDGFFDYAGRRQQVIGCGNLAVVLWSVWNIFIQVIFFWQWGRKLIKKDSEPTVFSFALATGWKPPMNRNLTQSVGHSVEQVSSMDMAYWTFLWLVCGSTVLQLVDTKLAIDRDLLQWLITGQAWDTLAIPAPVCNDFQRICVCSVISYNVGLLICLHRVYSLCQLWLCRWRVCVTLDS